MACNYCEGLLGKCSVCGHTNKPTHESWEERLDSRRHMGSHETRISANDLAPPVHQGVYSINIPGSFDGRPNYSRKWNTKYNGPGRGTN